MYIILEKENNWRFTSEALFGNSVDESIYQLLEGLLRNRKHGIIIRSYFHIPKMLSNLTWFIKFYCLLYLRQSHKNYVYSYLIQTSSLSSSRWRLVRTICHPKHLVSPLSVAPKHISKIQFCLSKNTIWFTNMIGLCLKTRKSLFNK